MINTLVSQEQSVLASALITRPLVIPLMLLPGLVMLLRGRMR